MIFLILLFLLLALIGACRPAPHTARPTELSVWRHDAHLDRPADPGW